MQNWLSEDLYTCSKDEYGTYPITLIANFNWQLQQFDVKSAMLHWELEEEICIEIPPGFVKGGEKNKIWKLKKALYGLK